MQNIKTQDQIKTIASVKQIDFTDISAYLNDIFKNKTYNFWK